MTDQTSGPFLGGSCVRAPGPGTTIANFVFSVADTDVARRVIDDMYVELDVRQNEEGDLAYALSVPDRGIGPWLITINPDDIGLIEETQGLLNTCPTFIRGEHGAVISLADFAMDLRHDWSGRYAKARASFDDGEIEEARGAVESLIAQSSVEFFHAYRLLGLCQLAQDGVDDAIKTFRNSIKLASFTGGDNLHRAASASLCDLATAYQKKGRPGAASICLLHALELRPNNPGALLDFASIILKEVAFVEFALARVLAIGGHDDAVAAWAEKNGASARLARAQELAGNVELSTWPYGNHEYASRIHLEAALDAPEAPPALPKPAIPLFGEPPAAAGASKQTTTAESESTTSEKNSWLLLVGIALGIVVLLVVIAYIVYSRSR